MAYAPGVQNRAGEYILRGAEVASRAMAEGINALQERGERERQLDQIGAYFLKDDPEGLKRFQEGSYADKAGAVAAIQLKQQQDRQDMEDYYKQDLINREWYKIKQDGEQWLPPEDVRREINAAGYAIAPTSRGSVQYISKQPKPQEPALGSDPTGSGKLMWNGSTLVARPDAKAKAPTEADVSFRTNVDMVKKGLDELESAIKRSGTYENGWFGNAEDSARLSALPVAIATQTAKILDPASVAREGEVEAMKKYMIPTGVLASRDKALAAIAQHRARIDEYAKARSGAKGADEQPSIPATTPTAEPAAKALAAKRDEALQWANANPQDPRAAKIKAIYGVQ